MRLPLLAALILLPGAIALPAGAQAQILGGGALGGVGQGAGAATGAVAGAVPSAATSATAPVIHETRQAAHDKAGGKAVMVKAGARVRVDRQTRCYDGTDYYDPDYQPDGYYYCETRGPGFAAGATVAPH